MASASADKYGSSFGRLKKKLASDDAEWETLLKALQNRTNESEHRVHEFERSKNTIRGLVSRLDSTVKALEKSEEQVQYLKNLVSEQCDQLFLKETKARN